MSSKIENLWIGHYRICKEIHNKFDKSGNWIYIDNYDSLRGRVPKELNVFLCPGWMEINEIGEIFQCLFLMEESGSNLEFFIKNFDNII